MLPVLITLFAACGVLFIVLALPLMRRSVPPNWGYGLRVEATFADEWVWYEANARTGRDMLIIGIVQFLLALLLPLAGVPEMVYAWVNIAYLLVATIAMAIIGVRRANGLLRERRAQTAA